MLPVISSINEEHTSCSLAPERAFHRFSLAEIHVATRHFRDDLVIGKGGFGKVYKGCISDGGATRIVAIKRLDSFSNQGPTEFKTEIEMLTKLRHCNLVSLIGYCSRKNEMILVYDYMVNGTIEHHLHKADTSLSWMQRLKISIGAAHGLQHLHTGVHTQHGIIHRDVKSSNILLDENWEAKISDFGLSKIIDQASSGVSTRVKGTFGYLDPTYCVTGKLTKESDVFSFGVVLFELLSGRRAVDKRLREEEHSLANWAKKCVKERRIDQLVSNDIRTQISPKCLKEFVQIADQCLRKSINKRPTMAEVVVTLQLSLTLQKQFDSSPRSVIPMGFTQTMQKYLALGFRHNSVSPTTPVEMSPILAKVPPSPLRVSPSPHRFSMSPIPDKIRSFCFTMDEAASATQNFSPSLILGEGGFGTVYKAQLPDGQIVAIKRARKEHFDALRSEFRSEVELVGKFDHRNLVKLLGSVDEGNEHLIITEYVPNGSLRKHLDGVHGRILDFNERLEICIDIAHGLTYLHLYAEKHIIHLDVKSSNVLLTERLRAKVTDFGFARLRDDKTQVTRLKGTAGYLDPEYMRSFQPTLKSDVFSFGILLIEILTGRRPLQPKRAREEKVTLRWVFQKYNKGEIRDLVDPKMKEVMDLKIFAKMLHLAIQCAAPIGIDRPNMKEAGERLWNIRKDYLRNGRIG